MSTTSNAKSLETVATIIGALAIVGTAYLIFATDGTMFRTTNWIISAAFLVYVVYNFINTRALRERISGLEDERASLQQELQVLRGELSSAKDELGQAQSALEVATAEIQNLSDSLAKAQQALENKE